MNRDWYDTPLDTRHPRVSVPCWDALTQFEKVCAYVAHTTEMLRSAVTETLRLEAIAAGPDDFCRALARLDIPVHPRLLRHIHGKVLNANKSDEFPPSDLWTSKQRHIFQEYFANDLSAHKLFRKVWQKVVSLARRPIARRSGTLKTRNGDSFIFNWPTRKTSVSQFAVVGADLEAQESALRIRPQGDRHAYLLLAGGDWGRLHEKSGWKVPGGHFVRGRVRLSSEAEVFLQIFVLYYDEQRVFRRKRLLGPFRGSDTEDISFSFGFRSQDRFFNLALQMPQTNPQGDLVLHRCELTLEANLHEGTHNTRRFYPVLKDSE
jgi:hypothetical protein